MAHSALEGECDCRALSDSTPFTFVFRASGCLIYSQMDTRPMPGGRIAASPYTIQCVAKLRVVRRDSGPLSILLLVKFLVRDTGGAAGLAIAVVDRSIMYESLCGLGVDQLINNRPFSCLIPTPPFPQPSSPHARTLSSRDGRFDY
jgi:hypothetical protein